MPSILCLKACWVIIMAFSILQAPGHGNLEGTDLDSLDASNVWKMLPCLRAEKHIITQTLNTFIKFNLNTHFGQYFTDKLSWM